MKNSAAQAAALIRKELKTLGIAATVSSKTYSMGSNVNVKLVDARPETMKLARKLCAKYEAGRFDGMTDCYEYSNTRDDLPQAKFVFVSNEMTEATSEAIYQLLRAEWEGGRELPATYEKGCNIRFQSHYISDMVRSYFSGDIEGYWTQQIAA